MWEPSLLTAIDTQVAEVSLREFRECVSILEGDKTEYEGRQLFED